MLFADAQHLLSDTEMALGERVKIRLGELGMSQEDLAKKTGVTQAAISALITRDSKSSRSLVALAEGLSCSPTWLETGKEPKEATVLRASLPSPLGAPSAVVSVDNNDGVNVLFSTPPGTTLLDQIDQLAASGLTPEEIAQYMSTSLDALLSTRPNASKLYQRIKDAANPAK